MNEQQIGVIILEQLQGVGFYGVVLRSHGIRMILRSDWVGLRADCVDATFEQDVPARRAGERRRKPFAAGGLKDGVDSKGTRIKAGCLAVLFLPGTRTDNRPAWQRQRWLPDAHD